MTPTQLTLQLFASARERCKADKITISTHAKTLSGALKDITNHYSELDESFLNKCRFSVATTLITDIESHILEPNKTYVIIPPISGG